MSEQGVTITLEAIYKTLMEVRDEQRDMRQQLGQFKNYNELENKVEGHTVHIKWLWTIVTGAVLAIIGVAVKGLASLFIMKGGN